jgi:hypothetical protein
MKLHKESKGTLVVALLFIAFVGAFPFIICNLVIGDYDPLVMLGLFSGFSEFQTEPFWIIQKM